MKYFYFFTLSLILFACGGSDATETPAPPENLGLETVPEDQPIVEMREVEDYNPDDDPRALDDLIRVTNLPTNALVSSPFTVRGEARGVWFFEGSFPIALYAEDGTILDESFGHSPESWMTEEFIPFESTIEFNAPSGTKAKLELMLDNPAGEEGKDRSIIIPVVIQ